MKRKKLTLTLLATSFCILAVVSFLVVLDRFKEQDGRRIIPRIVRAEPTVFPTPSRSPIPDTHVIPQKLHIFQSFNNCGPATLSMAMSYMGIEKDQDDLGLILRPYQVPGGDNDDKSVTLQEVADQAEEYGLISYLRPDGDIEKLHEFISNDIPVVARTWTKLNEDIGHFRIVRGYDTNARTILQDDSLQGKNLTYSENDFLELWRTFNYEYLVIVSPEKKEIVEDILGEELDETTAWRNALTRLEKEITEDPDNWHLTFALSRVYYNLGEYEKSIEAFEKVEDRLSFRTLWYQIEPIKSYYELGVYSRVFEITDRVLNNQNRAFSELYILRGKSYQKQGQNELARAEFEKAVQYNSNLQEAKDLLNSL